MYFTTEGERNDPCFPGGLRRIKRHPQGEEVDRFFYLAIIFALPLGLLLLLNIVVIGSLIRSMRKAEQLARSNEKSQAAQHQLSLMTGCICTLFFICEVPGCVDRILAQIFSETNPIDGISFWIVAAAIRKVGLLLITLDSTLNFFIYFITNKKFRSVLFNINI
jgi:hypothetical protein